MTEVQAERRPAGSPRRRREPRPHDACGGGPENYLLASSVVGLARRAAALGNSVACQVEDPHLWFSDLPADLELAKAHCALCPLRGPCLAGAIARAEPHGVWGGEIFDRGHIIAHKTARGRPPGRQGRARPDLTAGMPPPFTSLPGESGQASNARGPPIR